MGQPEESDLTAVLAGILPWLLGIYLAAKVLTLVFLSGRPLFDRPVLSVLFAVEMIVGVILPLLIFLRKENRKNPQMQYAGSLLIIAGLILNRFNVSMFGMIQRDQKIYYPSLIESVVTLGILAAHILLFYLIARYFPIFEHHSEATDFSVPDRIRKELQGRCIASLSSQADQAKEERGRTSGVEVGHEASRR